MIVLNVSIRGKAKQFSKLVRRSALTRRTGITRKPALVDDQQLGITFIGHSSFFVQIGAMNVVIDPIFAKWLFVLKRLRQPGLRIADLPVIDVVLVTHAHFDHLHRPSLRGIVRNNRRRKAPAPVIIIPRHVTDLVSDLGFRKIIELEWWQAHTEGQLTVTHTPAQHWGARIMRDMHRGFGGYVLHSGEQSLYHSGDTAYFHGFHDIGRRLAPQIALLPIGAYSPPSFRNVHTNPADAVRAFIDLGAEWMVPMHYGTFRLSHEPMDEPVQFLDREARTHGVRDRVFVLEEGVTRIWESRGSSKKVRGERPRDVQRKKSS